MPISLVMSENMPSCEAGMIEGVTCGMAVSAKAGHIVFTLTPFSVTSGSA